jgi:NADPH2:quinone reductase
VVNDLLMRALVFEGPADDTSRTRVAQLPRPEAGPDQVLIEVAWAGVNFKDVMVRRGDPGYAPSWPAVPGLEAAGRVRGTGANVRGLHVGERVVALTNAGGLAEFVVADAVKVVPVPHEVSLSAACVVPGVLTTAELLVRDFARVRGGDVIVVHSAAGAVGAAVAMLARRISSTRLVGVVGAPARVPAAQALGYEAVFVRSEGLASRIRDHLGGRGADVVLDPQGTRWLSEDLDMLTSAGRIVLFGNAAGGDLGPLPAPGVLYGTNTSVGGFSLAALSAHDPERIRAAMSRLLEGMAAGDLSGARVEVNGLDLAAGAQQRLAEGAGEGKYVVRVRPDD